MRIFFYEQTERGKKKKNGKKAYLKQMDSRMITILTLLYESRARNDVSTLQKTEEKETVEVFSF